MNGQPPLAYTAVAIAAIALVLLVALVRSMANTDRWRDRAFEAQAQVTKLEAEVDRMNDRREQLRRERDALCDGRTVYRALQRSDVEWMVTTTWS
jgi:uncharacterized protein YlxW (UPF0749 family)